MANRQDPETKPENLTAEERQALEEDYYKGDYSEPYAPGWILRQRAAHPDKTREEHKALEASGQTAPAEWYIEEVRKQRLGLPNIWTPWSERQGTGRAENRAPVDEEAILAAMRNFPGPMNKKGTYPKGEFMGLRGKAKRELWDRRNVGACG